MRRLTALVTAAVALAAGPLSPAQTIVAEPADDWTALFDRNTGWTGADGTFSISLNGRSGFGQGHGGTLFLFSDTFIGDVNKNGERMPGTELVNNSAAYLRGKEPRPDRITFHWGDDGQGGPGPLIVPDTPNSEPGDWYWVLDGLAIGNEAHAFFVRLHRTDDGGWTTEAVVLISIPLDVPDPLNHVEQLELPLYHIPDDGRGHIYFGNGILANTKEAGAPHPDGYLYVYGGQHDFIDKKLVVARIRPEDIKDPTAWRFWDGAEWQPDIDRTAPILSGSAGGAGVVALPDGRFLFVYQGWGFLPNIVARLAPTPVGPFGPKKIVYVCPESANDEGLLTYGTRVHPHLSDPGELLISYNVNSVGDFGRLFREADIYRPRFVRLRIEP